MNMAALSRIWGLDVAKAVRLKVALELRRRLTRLCRYQTFAPAGEDCLAVFRGRVWAAVLPYHGVIPGRVVPLPTYPLPAGS